MRQLVFYVLGYGMCRSVTLLSGHQANVRIGYGMAGACQDYLSFSAVVFSENFSGAVGEVLSRDPAATLSRVRRGPARPPPAAQWHHGD